MRKDELLSLVLSLEQKASAARIDSHSQPWECVPIENGAGHYVRRADGGTACAGLTFELGSFIVVANAYTIQGLCAAYRAALAEVERLRDALIGGVVAGVVADVRRQQEARLDIRRALRLARDNGKWVRCKTDWDPRGYVYWTGNKFRFNVAGVDGCDEIYEVSFRDALAEWEVITPPPAPSAPPPPA